ncbi:MAG TPA: 2-dehydropantoate 2-reductase [Gemmatimonadales bacterium]|nr:2-dehydropantoate 2-reductase [Gemmatimonadales bacterium]
MRIAVVGAGGVGAYFGARLAQAGEEVAFVARGAQLDALRTRGLRVESVVGDALLGPQLATDDPAEIGPVDAVLIAVKAWQVAEAARSVAPMLGPRTCVVPFQNGVEAADELVAVLGAGPVLGGVAKVVSFLVAPGHVRQIGGPTSAAFAELDDRPSERVARLRAAFRRAGLGVEEPPNIRVAIWEKFLFVVPGGSIGSVTRAPIGVSRAVPETRRLLERAMEEVRAVALARGIPLARDIVARTLAFVDTLPPNGTASLQRDIAAGRPSELDWWTGAVVRLGREAGVPTPVHEFVYHALLPLELRARGRLAFD